jgi:hypothetical protein
LKYELIELQRIILDLADNLHRFPTKKDIDDCKELPSYNTCIRNGVSLQELYRQWKVISYNRAPKQCLHCSIELSFEQSANLFCGHSCAAKHNNVFRGIAREVEHNKQTASVSSKTCPCCGSTAVGKYSTFCSQTCHKDYEFKRDLGLWLSGDLLVISNDRLRKFLTETSGYACSCCGITEWAGKPIVLEVEHKSGNSEDDSPENVCLICPNCHSQTSTYKARNKGNGRHYRRQRYAEGKSY